MAILNIVKEGDPVLRKTSREITEITPRIRTLIDDMRETLKKAEGVGLAAVQVGVLRRVVLVENDEGEVWELINPVITERSDEHQQELEGCLSVPGKWGVTDRPMKVSVEALDRDGNKRTVTGMGLTARALCHELDHLDGILFSDNALEILTEEQLQERAEQNKSKKEKKSKKK